MFIFTLAFIAIMANGYTAETVQHFETQAECREAAVTLTRAYRKKAGDGVFTFFQCNQGFGS